MAISNAQAAWRINPAAVAFVDFSFRDDGKGLYIDIWNEAVMGTKPASIATLQMQAAALPATDYEKSMLTPAQVYTWMQANLTAQQKTNVPLMVCAYYIAANPDLAKKIAAALNVTIPYNS